jgi:hypothetical protein
MGELGELLTKAMKGSVTGATGPYLHVWTFDALVERIEEKRQRIPPAIVRRARSKAR